MLEFLLGLYLLGLTPALFVWALAYTHDVLPDPSHREVQATWAAVSVPFSGALLMPWVILGCLWLGPDRPPAST